MGELVEHDESPAPLAPAPEVRRDAGGRRGFHREYRWSYRGSCGCCSCSTLSVLGMLGLLVLVWWLLS